MSLLRRVTQLYPDSSRAASKYHLLCDQMSHEACSWLGVEEVATWPHGTWTHGRRTVACSEWRPDPPATERLLHLEFRQQEGNGQSLTISATLGCSGAGSLFLVESWTLLPLRTPLELATLPALFSCLDNHPCRDEDGLLPGERYSLSAERISAFATFLSAPTRRLPVLLLSPRRDGTGGYSLAPSRAMMMASRGIAHIIRLRDEEAVEQWLKHAPNHGCYDGAVRLFWPAFRPKDHARAHPYKSARAVARLGWEATEQEFFSQLADYAARLFSQYDDLAELERAQDHAYQAQQSKLRQQREALADTPDYEALLELVEHERDEWRQRAETLETEVARLRGELRKERWKYHSIFARQEDEEDADESPTLYFSAEARRAWRDLDPDEQRYWQNHLFTKLLTPSLRAAQTEPVSGPRGTAWVYPRSRTGGGRRIIYYAQGEHIFVCMLYPAANHDDGYNRARAEGIDPSSFNDFQPWEPATPDAD